MSSHHAASGNEAQAWIAARLADLDLRLTGSDEPRVRPWSTVQRIETDGGPVWFKANGPGTTYEPGLVQALAELAPGHVLDPLATDVELGWALVPDGGPILRSFDDTDVLLVDRPGGLSRNQLSRLRDLEPTYAEWCAQVNRAGIPPSIEHGDLHDGNVFVRDGGYAIFDWGDACVAHPFASLLVTLSSIAHRYDLRRVRPSLQASATPRAVVEPGSLSRADGSAWRIRRGRSGLASRAVRTGSALNGLCNETPAQSAQPS